MYYRKINKLSQICQGIRCSYPRVAAGHQKKPQTDNFSTSKNFRTDKCIQCSRFPEPSGLFRNQQAVICISDICKFMLIQAALCVGTHFPAQSRIGHQLFEV
jgi:hypothetical protein